MASSISSSFQNSNLRPALLGQRIRICSPSVVPKRVSFSGNTIQCKESRIGKQPIRLPSNVAITLNGQELHVKGPLGELSRSYPQEVSLRETRMELSVSVEQWILKGPARRMDFLDRTAIPSDLQVKVEENTKIIICGYNKCNIGQFAATIRKWQPPEPYKGKGIRYANECIKLKEGKAGKKKQV